MTNSSLTYRRMANTWCVSALTAVLCVSLATSASSLLADEQPVFVSKVTVSLVREAKISARDAGLLSKIQATEGIAVKAGELIAVLDNDQQQLDVKAARLNLKVAQMNADDTTAVETANAQLQEARSGKVVKEIALKISETESKSDVPVQIAKAETQLRQLELVRAEDARKSFKGSISKSQIDRLKTSVEKGELEIRAAQNDHDVKQMKPDAERAALAQKEDEIRRFQALVKQGEKSLVVAQVSKEIRVNEVAVAELNLERRNLRAPFDGVIVEVNTSAGEWVEPGTTVARIVDLKTLRAEGFLPLQQASRDLVGRSVSLRMSNGSSAEGITGRVVFVSPEVDPVNQQVRFHAEFDNSKGNVLPGMNGTLTIEPNKPERNDRNL